MRIAAKANSCGCGEKSAHAFAGPGARTIGQEMGGWANLLERDIVACGIDGRRLDLAIGGSARGRVWNTHPEICGRAAKKIAE